MRTLDHLGLAGADLANLRRAPAYRAGLVIVAGHRRSGRRTTAQAIVNELDTGAARTAILCATGPAPPVGAAAPAQSVQPYPDAGAAAQLRTALAQDPDIILVDSLPGPRSARLAVQGAVQGRLVVCRLYAGRAHDLPLVFGQLGVAPAVLASCLQFILVQRLLPALCPACARPDNSLELRSTLVRAANSWRSTPVRGRSPGAPGCQACRATGYQ